MTRRATILALTCIAACIPASTRAAESRISDEARKHWAFQPIRPIDPPAVKGAGVAATEIDRFLVTKLQEKGLNRVGPADKLALIRRATFDLTGLPPTPEEVDVFLGDSSPDAFARLIDRLLASRHYGERWGRHWLDLVRYADTAGETADFPVPQAWRYRNYVIEAFNADKPYDQFIREQLAGDILAGQLPADAPRERFAELITATGYIAIARRFGAVIERDHYLTIEDTIDTLGKSLLALSVACARCHDHKHDPISVRDYYALYGVFDSTRYPYPGCEIVNRPKDMVPLMTRTEWSRTIQPHQQKLAKLDQAWIGARETVTGAAQQWRESLRHTRTELARGQFDNGGREDLPSRTGALARLFHVAAGEMIQLTVLPRANNGFDYTLVDLEINEVGGQARRWSAGADLSADLLAGNPHADRHGNLAAWWLIETSGGERPVLLATAHADLDSRPAAGLTAWGRPMSPLALGNPLPYYAFALGTAFPGRSLTLHPTESGGVTVAWISPASMTVRISGRLVDLDSQGGDGVAWVLEHVRVDRPAADERTLAYAQVAADAKRVRDAHAAAAPKVEFAYAVNDSVPHDAAIQIRGDFEKPGPLAPRRFLEILGGQQLPPNSGSGRLQLAEWIVSPDNPLTARVIVNRVWQHHFGRGIVKTPSDFGLRGQPPTHPELLDWLTSRFIESGWSIKKLHRLIMLTQAYQLASSDDRHALRIDPANDLHWRFNRRRLSAEEIRDTLLSVSGDLDRAPGGSHPFPDENTWGYTQHAPFSQLYDSNKRSVYLMVQRIKRHPFLALFDGADPSASTAERIDTTVPTQALFFMNDPFVFARSESFADKLMSLPDDSARIDRAFRLCFGRAPTEVEREQAIGFLRMYQEELSDGLPEQERKIALAAYVRSLFGSNEMMYVD